jgi:hypothetical protein
MENEKLSKSQLLKLKAKQSALSFKRELKKSVTTALAAAFGFLIALSWREVITSWIEKISSFSPIKGNFISAILITIISVIGILLVSKFSNEK